MSIVILDYMIPFVNYISEKINESIKNWSDWIDYWSIDFNYQDDAFNTMWASYRTSKERVLKLESDPYYYDEPGTYKIKVKSVDIFGFESSTLLEIDV